MDIALIASRRVDARYRIDRAGPRVILKTSPIVAWMFAAMAAVIALAYWDEQRESNAALQDFAKEQATLAESLAASLGERLTTLPLQEALHARPVDLLAAIRSVEHQGLVRVLVARPGDAELVGSEGERVGAPSVAAALGSGLQSMRLARSEAVALDLPKRTAVAGLHQVDAAGFGRWGVAVIVTAQTERDRELRAQWRLVLGVAVASGLVFAFGGYALRKQRRELEHAHQLALTKIRNEGDERLVRADKLATMGAMATGIAHEVSTPLGVILGRAEQILPKQTDDRARRAVETIVQQSERIFAVMRGFLTLARGGTPTLAHCDPVVLAQAAVGLVEHRFERAAVQLDLRAADGIGKVACDARLFEQVLVNLLLNACDACGEGGSVELSVQSDGQRVAFTVTDDGIGISPEVATRATEPFFTTKPAGEGTGLGLAIANEIVKHHCGSLTLAPGSTGKGTRVTVELPSINETRAQVSSLE
jgi:signal transduction histidine kinase